MSTTIIVQSHFAAPTGEQTPVLVVLSGSQKGRVINLQFPVLTFGRGDSCDVVLDDDGLSREHCRISRDNGGRPGLLIIEDLGSTNGTWVNHSRVSRRHLEAGDRLRIGAETLLRFDLHDSQEEDYHREMYDAAVRDGLTGLYNRRYFSERLENEISFCKRHGTAVSLVMFDADHFKNVNDTHGHPAGDALLCQLSKILLELCRREDVVARFGGDEFAVLARGLDERGVYQFAERLRTAIEATVFREAENTFQITLSIGTATSWGEKETTPVSLLKTADSALYRAKDAGRNCVFPKVVYAPDELQPMMPRSSNEAQRITETVDLPVVRPPNDHY